MDILVPELHEKFLKCLREPNCERSDLRRSFLEGIRGFSGTLELQHRLSVITQRAGQLRDETVWVLCSQLSVQIDRVFDRGKPILSPPSIKTGDTCVVERLSEAREKGAAIVFDQLTMIFHGLVDCCQCLIGSA